MTLEDTDVAPLSMSLPGRLSEQSGIVFRSNAAAASTSAEGSSSALNSADDAEDVHEKNNNCFAAIDTNGAGDGKDDDTDPITLPKSTHTLLFTEPINSAPFIISVFIAALSILCLLLTLLNNGAKPGEYKDVIPANVPPAVKIAQYASIIIALLMEEEIPTGLYLLRRIPKQYFISKFRELKYSKFVCSCILRILIGYLFLVNILLVLVQATDVLSIFYDLLALQFVQQLDDIAFRLAQMNALSKRLKEATTRRYFRVEFKVSKLGRSRRISIFLKAVYFLNLGGLLAGMIFVSVKQSAGAYQCQSISVRMNEDIWQETVIKLPDDMISPIMYEDMPLVYSFFSGVYTQDGTSHDGRPVYVEMNKFDNAPFDASSPDPWSIPVKVAAKLQYCKDIRAWAFTHEYIRKSRRDDSDCPWLLRSEETDVYDIEEVQGPWLVWEGAIETTDVHIYCNECSDSSDCNLNGECKDGSCECYDDVDGVTFLGPHCEVRVKDECRTIAGEFYNDTWSVINVDWAGEKGFIQEYNRPFYMYQGGLPESHPWSSGLNQSDAMFFIYSGSRWFGSYQEGGKDLFTEAQTEFTSSALKNYHAFWDRVYNTGDTSRTLVSDPTKSSTPVGVDFYVIGERGEQYGNYGVLIPLQNETGRGLYRCVGPMNDSIESVRKLQGRSGVFGKYLRLPGKVARMEVMSNISPDESSS